jgi:hypothetical protein
MAGVIDVAAAIDVDRGQDVLEPAYGYAEELIDSDYGYAEGVMFEAELNLQDKPLSHLLVSRN